MRRMFLFVTLLVLLAGSNAAAQATPPTPGPSEALARLWNEAGGKVIEMAEDFPEEKYDFKPTPEVRSFAEQMLHVAGGNYLFMDLAQGKRPGAEDLSREKSCSPRRSPLHTAMKKEGEPATCSICSAKLRTSGAGLKSYFASGKSSAISISAA